MQTRLVSVMTMVAIAAACGIGGFALGQTRSQSIEKQLLRREAEQTDATRALLQRVGEDREASRAISCIDEQSLSHLADLIGSRLQHDAKPSHDAPAAPTAP